MTHVALADDMTLIANSWTSLKRMVILLRESLQRRGLELHPSKCKAQTNRISWSCRGNIQILPDFALNVLHETACLEVLGTSLSLLDTTASEIDHRIAVGWSKFWALKRLLLNRNVSIKKRLQLFDSTVASSILYGSHAWTPRSGEMRKVHTVQNRMLRKICGVNRRPDELWLDWLKRATRRSRQMAVEASVRDWVHAHACRKWLWAGHAARRSTSTWLWRVLSWRDSDWNRLAKDLGGARLLRPSRQRWMKWEDPLRRFMAENLCSSWTTSAQEKATWNVRAEEFAAWFAGEE